MNEQEQRIALAEWAGTKRIKVTGTAWGGDGRESIDFPDYPADLNAVHNLEMRLDWKPDDEYCQAQEYAEQLVFVCGRNIPKAGNPFGYVCHLCGEQIYDSQANEHSDEGMIHTQCPEPDCYEWHLITATAAQRCEALCRVLWPERWK
jgi:hypothetical protein